MKQPKILDNKNFGKVGDEIKENIKKGSNLSIISAYFTIFAYKELYKELSKVDKVRFIFTEPTFIKKDKEKIRHYYIKVNSEDTLSGTDFEIKLRNKMTQANIAKECSQWLKDKVEFKSLKDPNPAQQRLIYIENKDNEDIAINGSVDFTTEGLGYTPSSRMDMNTCMYGREYTNQFLAMFNRIWNDSSLVEDVKDKVLEYMQIIYKENTPEFIYFMTLYNIFKDYLEDITEESMVKTKTGFKETIIWNKLYKFQKDGVLGAIDKLENHNGCIIADSVGLGKTFSALAIIKYYELRNHRVLVLAPKKLRDNWIIYTKNDKRNILVNDRFNYDVLNHTDLTRECGQSGDIDLKTINWGNYDLVVIDESHNFRNNKTKEGKVTRYSKLLDDIVKSGVKTKILMLSATPVNNKMNDLKNQITFITEGKDNSFEGEGILSVENTLKKAQTVFNQWSNLEESERSMDNFIDMMNQDYFKLLDTITIARSRKHIEKYYGVKEVGKFPKRLKPINKKTGIDELNEFPELQHVNKLIKNLNLGFYSPLKYVLEDKKAAYDKKYDMSVNNGQSVFKMTDREQSIVNLMRVNILKRLESSIYSFNKTIEGLLDKINMSLDKIRDLHNEAYETNLDINSIEIDDGELEDLLIGNKVKVLIGDMDVLRWKQDLEDDRVKLEEIHKESKKIVANVKRDTKLNALKELIKEKINNPINEDNKKVMIFSAFADTTDYLYENISKWALDEFGIHTGLVTGTGNNKTTAKDIKRKELNDILTNFSPISKEKAKICPEIESEIDILIATDCISEGQNCQDCDYLINYDIHWNPVRIIQRFGRIDRLGSKNEKIQLVNFWANMELDEYINLENRVTGRMMLLDISATGEENIISNEERKAMNDLEYRKKQLQQLQEEVVDLEDISGGISITDLTMNDFKMDLSLYMKDNLSKLESAPKGMYAIVDKEDENIDSGVIFTLKQISNISNRDKGNNLYPYYLVYINDSGEVKINYLRAKKVLDLYRKLCKNKNEVIEELIQIFNKETNDGSNMGKYTALLEGVVENIIGKKEEKGIASLFSKGGTTAKKKDVKDINDFELISFLIIK